MRRAGAREKPVLRASVMLIGGPGRASVAAHLKGRSASAEQSFADRVRLARGGAGLRRQAERARVELLGENTPPIIVDWPAGADIVRNPASKERLRRADEAASLARAVRRLDGVLGDRVMFLQNERD
ncbi:MAG TPA: hypothetical protein VIF40_19150 [Methylosinus sp.]